MSSISNINNPQYFTTTAQINTLHKIEWMFFRGENVSELQVVKNITYLIRFNPNLRFSFHIPVGTVVYVPIVESKQDLFSF